jgi:hypothetical protein
MDNKDGSYTVCFKPMSSGTCTINIAYRGELVANSPYSCVVSTPTPCAAHCEVSGDALRNAVVQRSENFFLTFRDVHGQLAHACELDVWIKPLGMTTLTSSRYPQIENLLRPLSAFESFCVGPNALDVTRTRDVGSEKVGRLQPGRFLKVLKVEDIAEDGLVRACVALEMDDRDGSSWRELWPSQQDWRTPSWRFHIDEIKQQQARQQEELAMRVEMARHNAATTIQSVRRSALARRFVVLYRIQRQKEAAQAAIDAARRQAMREQRRSASGLGRRGFSLAADKKSANDEGAQDKPRSPKSKPSAPPSKTSKLYE